MIEPMVRYDILVYHKTFEAFLANLQQQGLLDIKIKVAGGDGGGCENTPSKALYKEVQEVERLIRQLKLNKAALLKQGKSVPETRRSQLPAMDLLKEYDVLIQRRNSFLQQQEMVLKILENASIWGDFDIDQLNRLKESGMQLFLVACDAKYLTEDVLNAYAIRVIEKKSNKVYFLWVEYKSDRVIETLEQQHAHLFSTLNFPIEVFDWPLKPYSQLLEEKQLFDQEQEKLDRSIGEFIGYIEYLEEEKIKLLNKFHYTNITEGVERIADGTLVMIQGYLPVKSEPSFKDFLEQEEVVYQAVQAKEIENKEEIPVKLKNNAFARLFEPITNLFALPVYEELDLTPFFAPFFMMFFGFCFGDAGYGLFLMAVAAVLLFKLPKKFKDYASLLMYFGLATVVFGGLSGTFFGMELAKVEALAKFKDYFLNYDNMMMLSLGLGGVQILYAMLVKVINISRQKGFKYAVGPLAWLVALLSAIPVIAHSMGIFTLPVYVLYTLYAFLILSVLPILFYNSPGKSVFLNFGLGLWDSYNMATGLVGDLLSYIRLFALGLTGGILGGVFNTLAVDMSGNIPVVSQLIMLLILAFGHSLNIVLCMLSSVVHPLRLTFVEFYKNAGFTGGGRPYQPFKLIKNEK